MSAAGLRPRFSAVDLFCGAGGLTYGFRSAGLPVCVGVDIDETCRYPLEWNNRGTRFELKDVAELSSSELRSWYPVDADVRVLVGCAPCQPFSKYAVRAGSDGRWRLLYEFGRLVREVMPDVVSMENVPDLKRSGHRAYRDFVAQLERLGYAVWSENVKCADFGVPQTRERLVLIARLGGSPISLVPKSTRKRRTVRDAIGALPAIEAGGSPDDDALHIAPALSPTNVARIRATPEGGSWRDWPGSLRLRCHQRETGKFYGSVYGRMKWDDLGPTITTQCYGYGNGRFGHPTQDRAISLREAALLQTFPRGYRFSQDSVPRFVHVGRHIGNAVPVSLARAIANAITQSFDESVVPSRNPRSTKRRDADTRSRSRSIREVRSS